MPKFMIEQSISLARPASEDGRTPPASMQLKVLSLIQAETEEDVQNKVVQYRYPGFISRIEKITELRHTIDVQELFQDFEHNKVIQEDLI